ncbi:unnamed protein product [Bursaphelenchus okinawaensis]|uniref:Lipase n=1 Tax=Bursaphelenchus okinawaensis TaxID=465554 RepID=A0A811KYN7_9BILA|nr:unnamed protein product [Bursaphelenchus okinawaensis]CAG9114691.1 unnamed protein product [Bursaphelenchus okinawaensis]
MIRTFVFLLFTVVVSFANVKFKELGPALPEEGLRTDTLIKYWGYSAEKHYVTTEDGYIIEIHRIPRGKDKKTSNHGQKPVVLCMHGLLESSASYVFNLPSQSPAYVFADHGFDVWLGNVRGNTYGRNHTILSTKDEKFWKFSWPDHAHKDLPAILDKIYDVTGQKRVYYVGHSQGNLILFAQLAENPEFSNRIIRHFALAPVYTVKHIKGLLWFLAKVVYPNQQKAEEVLGNHEFMGNHLIIKAFARMICDSYKGQHEICNNIIALIDGPNSNQLNVSRLSVYTSHSPAGTSTQNLLHWLQNVYTGIMEKYDYRNDKLNVKAYGHITPPKYDISKIRGLKLHIYSSEEDWLADPDDMLNLMYSMPEGVVQTEKIFPDWSHLDFLWGTNVTEYITLPIIQTIQKYDGIRLR